MLMVLDYCYCYCCFKFKKKILNFFFQLEVLVDSLYLEDLT